MHLSIRKETTDTAVNTTVVSNNITVHPRVTQVITQVVQIANFGLMRLRVGKFPLASLNVPNWASAMALRRRGYSSILELRLIFCCLVLHTVIAHRQLV